jgi:iron complex outermembrane receptor protein
MINVRIIALAVLGMASGQQANGLAPKNPLGQLYLRKDQSDVDRFITNLQLDYTLPFFKDLRANLNIGYDHSKAKELFLFLTLLP